MREAPAATVLCAAGDARSISTAAALRPNRSARSSPLRQQARPSAAISLTRFNAASRSSPSAGRQPRVGEGTLGVRLGGPSTTLSHGLRAGIKAHSLPAPQQESVRAAQLGEPPNIVNRHRTCAWQLDRSGRDENQGVGAAGQCRQRRRARRRMQGHADWNSFEREHPGCIGGRDEQPGAMAASPTWQRPLQ